MNALKTSRTYQEFYNRVTIEFLQKNLQATNEERDKAVTELARRILRAGASILPHNQRPIVIQMNRPQELDHLLTRIREAEKKAGFPIQIQNFDLENPAHCTQLLQAALLQERISYLALLVSTDSMKSVDVNSFEMMFLRFAEYGLLKELKKMMEMDQFKNINLLNPLKAVLEKGYIDCFDAIFPHYLKTASSKEKEELLVYAIQEGCIPRSLLECIPRILSVDNLGRICKVAIEKDQREVIRAMFYVSNDIFFPSPLSGPTLSYVIDYAIEKEALNCLDTICRHCSKSEQEKLQERWKRAGGAAKEVMEKYLDLPRLALWFD